MQFKYFLENEAYINSIHQFFPKIIVNNLEPVTYVNISTNVEWHPIDSLSFNLTYNSISLTLTKDEYFNKSIFQTIFESIENIAVYVWKVFDELKFHEYANYFWQHYEKIQKFYKKILSDVQTSSNGSIKQPLIGAILLRAVTRNLTENKEGVSRGTLSGIILNFPDNILYKQLQDIAGSLEEMLIPYFKLFPEYSSFTNILEKVLHSRKFHMRDRFEMVDFMLNLHNWYFEVKSPYPNINILLELLIYLYHITNDIGILMIIGRLENDNKKSLIPIVKGMLSRI